MHRFWDLIIEPVISALEPHVIVEVGSEAGINTRHLLEYAEQHDAVVHAIDPLPVFDVDEWAARYGDVFVFHLAKSLNALPKINGADLVLLDGDHNWYTVYHELKLIERRAKAKRRPLPVILLHDVAWPYGRRDLYYDPESIPAAHRQPHRKAGMRPDRAELVDEGGLNAHLENAIYENDVHNGVRTALEDFTSELKHEAVEVQYLPGLHGLGILVPSRRVDANPVLRTVLDGLTSAEFLLQWSEALERHRVEATIATGDRTREARVARERTADAEQRAGVASAKAADAEARAQEAIRRTGELEQTVERSREAIAHSEALRSELEAARSELDATRAELERVRGSEDDREALEARSAEAEAARDEFRHELERSVQAARASAELAERSLAELAATLVQRHAAAAEAGAREARLASELVKLHAEVGRIRKRSKRQAAEQARLTSELSAARLELEQVRAGLRVPTA